jgi:hypothetical protein
LLKYDNKKYNPKEGRKREHYRGQNSWKKSENKYKSNRFKHNHTNT